MNRSIGKNRPRRMVLVLAGGVSVCLAASQAEAGVAYGLTSDNRLSVFDTGSPSAISRTTSVTGLAPAEDLLGIDFRPAEPGQLYGLGSLGQVYKINASSGAASAVGTPLDPATAPLLGRSYGFDFNPVVDRIRVVSDLGENLRVSPVDGSLSGADAELSFAAGDENEGIPAGVTAAAYTNSDTSPALSTQLFGIVPELGVLVLQSPPNEGTLNTVGSLGLDELPDFVGFDIVGGEAFAITAAEPAFGAAPALGSKLYQIDLGTGLATDLGSIGNGAGDFSGFALLNGGDGGGTPNPIPLPPAVLAAPLAVGLVGARRFLTRKRREI